jgi:hypothetical protein
MGGVLCMNTHAPGMVEFPETQKGEIKKKSFLCD